MPRFSAREIGRIETSYTSDLGELSWEWVIRVDGTVQYRLNRVDDKAERNPWQIVYRLTPAQRRMLDAEPRRAADLLARIAGERGHYPAGAATSNGHGGHATG